MKPDNQHILCMVLIPGTRFGVQKMRRNKRTSLLNLYGLLFYFKLILGGGYSGKIHFEDEKA
ncbi:hypothetical protein GCM10007968_14920 [Sporolactobacillus putidus]|uniref:Uncharacterized protein n=1 Tax=Sporolactobacillus putidus TaxID=492735 RepID=A0A917S2Z0_9BACL|nr:hypothetical protein GCM10007968_14920 [Sporolactobacillus putidus]